MIFEKGNEARTNMIPMTKPAGVGRSHLRSCALLSLFTAIALAGCSGVPQTQVSLSDPGETPYDQRLIGFWQMSFVAEDGDRGEDTKRKETEAWIGAFHLQIWPREHGVLSVLGVQAEALSDTPVSWIQADAHASEIDGGIYYNLKLRAVDRQFYSVIGEAGRRFQHDLKEPHIILQVKLSDEGNLFLHFMNPFVIANLIEEGRISGRDLSCGEHCFFLAVDSSRQELIGLIRELGPGEFFAPIGFGPFHRGKADTERVRIQEFYENWRLKK